MRNAFGINRTRLGHGRKHLLHLCAEVLDASQIGALDLDADCGLDAGELHVEAVFNGHGPRVGEAWELQLLVHLANEFVVGHAGAPLLARLKHDGGVVHIERGIVGGTIRPADGSEHRRDLGERTDDSVLLLHQGGGLRDGDSRQ